jgi:membrane-associated phospholipid phosphatase
VVRRRSDLAWFGGAAVVLGGCSVVIDGNSIAAFEESAFRVANDASGAIYPVLWPVMQFGTFISVPLVAIGALAMKRIRLAIEASAAGVSTYFLAKVVKDLFPRDRPGAFLEDVHLRGIGTGGRGYPSGHAAVASSLAFVLWAYLPRRWRWVPVGVAGVVCFGRMFVGGHLPLDVVGGAALGIVCGAVATFVGGAPDRNEARSDATEAASEGPGRPESATGEAAG